MPNVHRTTLFASALAILSITLPAHAAAPAKEPVVRRQILICASSTASPAVQKAADDLAEHAKDVPLLKAMTETQSAGPIARQSSEAILKDPDLAAYNHLIVLGLKSADPLVAKVWEHYASVDESKKTMYAQGWGHLQGDLGYIESDRNPFLHSRRIKEAPYETIVIKITGTSEAGLLAAIDAFKSKSLLNGFVPVGKFTRPQTTLLDLDPLLTAPELPLPKSLPLGDSELPLVGWSQVPANEYRAILQTTNLEPTAVWRYKYLRPNALDDAGIRGWMAGFHRMAYGNALNILAFPTPKDAQAAAGKIGAWTRQKTPDKQTIYQLRQPTDEVMDESLGQITTWPHGRYVIMSTLNEKENKALMDSLQDH